MKEVMSAPGRSRFQAAIDYVASSDRAVPWLEVVELFVEHPYDAAELRAMRAALDAAVARGDLAACGARKRRTHYGHAACAFDALEDEAEAAPEPRWVGPVVPPPQRDWRAAPVYTPPPDAPLRPGAADARAIKSRGVRC